MKILRLMACAAIFGSIAASAEPGAGAMPDPSAAARVAGEDGAPIVHVQYGEERPGGWNGRPGWYGDPSGQQNWPSQWGGGWYGGWYQPYWGQGAWATIMGATPRQAPVARMDAASQPRTTLL